MHIRFSDDAIQDLKSIKDYLEPKNPVACDRVLSTVFTTIEQLERFPFLGHPGEVEGTRELSVVRYTYVIVYSIPDEINIDIERILHTSLQYPPEDD